MTSEVFYTVKDICRLLQISQASFFALKQAGRLPYLEELQPKTGRKLRFRKDLVDRYLAGQWQRSAFHRRQSA